MTSCQRVAVATLTIVAIVVTLSIGVPPAVVSADEDISVSSGNGRVVFYVSPSGSDTNPGSREKPFQTLFRAQQAVRAVNSRTSSDIVVYLFGGTYQLGEPLVFDSRDSGRDGHLVVWQNVPGQKPVISGGQEITGWRLFDPTKNIWVADIPFDLDTRQFYVNNVRAVRARSGNGLPGAQRTSFGYTTTDYSMQYWPDQGDLEFVYDVLWTEERCGVDHIVGNEIYMKQPCFATATLPQRGPLDVGVPNYIENAFELLDAPGEWYLSRRLHKIYYVPRPGEDMHSATAVAPRLEMLIEGKGTFDSPIHDIEFKGLTFAYATWLRPNSASGFVENQANVTVLTPEEWLHNPPGAAEMTPGNISFVSAYNIRFERDIFTHLGGAGLSLKDGVRNNVIRGCIFTDISSNGIELGDVWHPFKYANDPRAVDSGNQIVNNYIHDVAVEYHGGVGIWEGYTENLLIAHNVVANLPYTGISTGWGWGAAGPAGKNNQIVHNLVYNTMQLLVDGGGIYSNSIQPGQKIADNVVYGQKHRQGGIYLDDGSQYNTIENNVLYNNTYNIFLNDNIGGVLVQYNFLDSNTIQDVSGGETGRGGAPHDVIRKNTVVTRLSEMPASIVSAAGLEWSYRDLIAAPVSSDRVPPSRPGHVEVALRTNGSIVLTWLSSEDNVGVTGYEIDEGDLVLGVVPPEGPLSFTVDGLRPDTAYRFAVRARDAAANLSPEAQIRVATLPPQPVPSYLPAPGLVLWLRADTGTIVDNNSKVSLWIDQSGVGHDAIQLNPAAQPVLVGNALNGKPILRFCGTDCLLSTAWPVTTSTEFSIFVVSTLNANGGAGAFYNGNAGFDGYGFYRLNAASYGLLYGGIGFLTFGPVSTFDYQLDEALRGTDGAARYYVDAAQSGAVGLGVPNPATGRSLVGQFTGDIGEVIIYDRGLSDTERHQVEQYLIRKFGL